MASVLLAGTSARTLPAMFALIVGEAFASYGIRDPITRVLQSHTWKFLGARGASSCHVACTMVGLDLVDYGWTGSPDHSGKTILTLSALT